MKHCERCVEKDREMRLLTVQPGEHLELMEDGFEIGDPAAKWRSVTTRSDPWQLGNGAWVVLIKGKSGGYALARMRRPENAPEPA